MFESLNRSRPGLAQLVVSLFAAASLTLASGLVQAGGFTNFANMKFIDIPAGSFKMGSCKVTTEMRKDNKRRVFLGLPPRSTGCETDNPNVNDNETPQHTVNIRAFRMGQTPVTLGQFKQYVAAIGATDGSSGWNLVNDEFKKLNAYGDNAPVVQVSWLEAKEFIDWLNHSKPADDHHVYRLATEAEWEYACRANGNHAYCGSDNGDEVGWIDRNNNPHQRDVATKAPNAWGLYDMTGNVWQWVEDAYHDTYVGAPTDGSAWTAVNLASQNAAALIAGGNQGAAEGPARAVRVSTQFSDEQKEYDAAVRARRGKAWKRDTTTARVLRGGSWRFGYEFARATYRLSGAPGNWYYGNGFRVAATLPK